MVTDESEWPSKAKRRDIGMQADYDYKPKANLKTLATRIYLSRVMTR